MRGLETRTPTTQGRHCGAAPAIALLAGPAWFTAAWWASIARALSGLAARWQAIDERVSEDGRALAEDACKRYAVVALAVREDRLTLSPGVGVGACS